MLTRLKVHHVLSNDVTSVHSFSLLFGIREIPSELGAKVKGSPSSLRVFVTPEEAANESFLAIDWIIFVPYLKAIDAKLKATESGSFYLPSQFFDRHIFIARAPRGNNFA